MQPNPFLYLTADRHCEAVLSAASELRRTFSEADLARIRQRKFLPAVLVSLCTILRWITCEFEPTPLRDGW
jgi:hypothetical protein